MRGMNNTFPVPRQLVQNALWITEGDLYLKSTHRHDWTSHKLADGTLVFTDGGLAYVHRSELPPSVVEWDLYDNDRFDLIAARLLWGTRGKDGKSPLRHRPIASFELDHLHAILKTQLQIKGTIVERVVRWWIAQKEPAA